MGQFKPMVKMMTTEPSVELKLAKGGAVAMKKGGSTTKAKKMAMGGLGAMSAPSMPSTMPAAPAAGPAPKKPSLASRRKAMMAAKAPVTPVMKKGGKVHEDAAEDRAMIKKALAGKKYATGGVVKGQGGYKTGGVIDGQGGYANGGIIKSVTGKTKVVTATADNSPAKTGDVKLGNGGGYKKGGKAKKFADGGSVQDDGRPVKMPQGQKTPSKPVSITQLSGTFKKGGKVTAAESKLRAAHKAENAPAFKAAKSVEIDRYSKYQKSGKKMAMGGEADHASAAESEGYKKFYDDEKAENEATRRQFMNAIAHPIESMKKLPGKLAQGFNALRGAPGSVTKTKESVTVSPGKKRGGRAC
jgi:hypothetical protein